MMIIPVKNNHFAAPVGSKLKNRVIVQLYFVNMDCGLVKSDNGYVFIGY